MSDDTNSLELNTLQQTPTQIKLNNFSDEALYDEIDKYFPYKDSAGFPTYRQYQRISIFNALKAFQQGARCVIIDGPVGSGKSIINYTIGRVCGSAVYLTPQKNLQDQISNENWNDSKMVKGRNAYNCNYSSEKYNRKDIPCDYIGDECKMCHNAEELESYDKSDFDEELIKTSILRTLETYKTDKVQRSKFTSFELNENLDNVFSRIKSFISNKDNETGKITKYPIANLVGCKLAPVECSVKSARIVSKIYQMKILNPDIYFALTRRAPEFYGPIDLLIIDECHSLESVISRIFATKIPIDMMKILFGLDLTSLLYCENPEDFAVMYQGLLKSRIGPVLMATKIFNEMGDTIKARLYHHKDGSYKSNIRDIKSQTEYALYLKMIPDTIEKLKLDFSIIHLANLAFTNSFDSFIKEYPNYECFRNFVNYIRSRFVMKCDEYHCDNHINFHKDFFINAEQNLRQFSRFPNQVMKDLALINYSIEFMEVADLMVDKISQMVNYKTEEGYRVFIFNIGEGDSEYTCKGSEIEQLFRKYKYDKELCKYIEIVPANIGSLMHYAFYRFAHHILMSSGTWCDWSGMIKVFGLNPKKDIKYLKIPSTFSTNRRPIYVLDNADFTNYSQKTKDGDSYVYKTPEGQIKWLKELEKITNDIRNFVGRQRNISPDSLNALVHSHSFSITKVIAEFGYINDKWIIHNGSRDMVINKNSNKIVNIMDKNKAIAELVNNPDCGLTLVSPSVSEGVDMINGRARINIVVKHPIPYLGDPYVNLRLYGNKDIGAIPDRNFLTRNTLITLIQSYGRTTRSTEDWSYTFFLDQKVVEDLKNILCPTKRHQLSKLNIEYMTSAIKMKVDEYGRPVFSWIE